MNRSPFLLVLLLLTAGCVQRNNIFYPAPTQPPEAHVIVPPTLTPQQQDCLAGFTELVNAGAETDQLRAWANEARQREGCSELRLFIDGRPAVPSPAAETDSPPANEAPARLLVELPSTPTPPTAGPAIHLVERRIKVPGPTVTIREVEFRTKTLLERSPPPLCPACAACPSCPPPPTGGGDSQPGGSALGYVTSLALGGGLAYALCYFQILSVPGLAPPGLPSGDLPQQSEAAAVAAAPAADDLADPRVRVRSAQLGEWSG